MTAQTINHAAEAVRLVDAANEKGDIREAEVAVAAAQVHATLALAAAQGGAEVVPQGPAHTLLALQAVADAWDVEGRDPVEHRRAQADLRLRWPVLASAVEHAARVGARR